MILLVNDKIIFDSYYFINSAKTKEIMVHYILQPHQIIFYSYARSGRTSDSNHSMRFAWRTVSSIIKCHVLTARAHVNHINKWLFFVNIWL